MTDRRPIGVFDSGAGGLTVVRALRRALPAEDIVYLGDTARVPYGTKSPRTVERYSLACQRFLLGFEVKLVLVACNTASATALAALEGAASVPVIGAVVPGARAAAAASSGGRIGVIGTLSTIASGAYERAIAEQAPRARVTALGCPLLVPLAEEGWVRDEVAALVTRRYLATLFNGDADIDTLLLGCTHYPLLRDDLAAAAAEVAGRPVKVVDSATAMAREARRAVRGPAQPEPTDERRGRLACYVTDASRLPELAPRFLGEPLDAFELVDI